MPQTQNSLLRLEVTHDAKRALDRTVEKLGLSQTQLASAAVNWFVKQDATVQAIVLGFYPEKVEHDLAALLVKALK
jgi:hypothetical protein